MLIVGVLGYLKLKIERMNPKNSENMQTISNQNKKWTVDEFHVYTTVLSQSFIGLAGFGLFYGEFLLSL